MKAKARKLSLIGLKSLFSLIIKGLKIENVFLSLAGRLALMWVMSNLIILIEWVDYCSLYFLASGS